MSHTHTLALAIHDVIIWFVVVIIVPVLPRVHFTDTEHTCPTLGTLGFLCSCKPSASIFSDVSTISVRGNLELSDWLIPLLQVCSPCAHISGVSSISNIGHLELSDWLISLQVCSPCVCVLILHSSCIHQRGWSGLLGLGIML